ncbi:MAG: hypothetical protein LBD27_01575 [Tannerella sp.]|jgi:hypothetical protein|nr:hypothetical protein [Tannerella sp.]
MNDRQNAKQTMFQTVYNTCREYASVYAHVPAFSTLLEKLNQYIVLIRGAEGKQLDAQSKGVTEEKTDAEDRLILSLLKVSGALYVYAFHTGNKDLTVKANLNKSMLFRMEDNLLLATAGEMAAKAAELAGLLTAYGIGTADLEELNACKAAFELLIVKPRTVIGEHKVYTSNLARLFAETDSLLHDGLDKLINLFKVSAPDFYLSYKNARNVINTSARKRKTSENGNV